MADGPGEPGGRTIEALSRQLVAARAEREEARAERDEAQAQQAALAEVLLAISRSAGNLKQVFDTLVDRAVTLCAAAGGELVTFEDDLAIAASLRNVRPALAEFWRTPQRIAGTNLELVRRSGRTIHRPDMREVEGYQKRVPLAVAGVELGGIRTFLQVPLKNEHEVLGLFMIFRHEVRPFSDRQVALVEAFANQAAIAMENARLLAGQREALERQTATAEILAVINASPGNLTPVFDAILDKARRLCDAAHGDLWTYDGEMLHLAASHGEAGFAAWLKAQGPVPVWPGSPTEALLKGADHVQYEDPIRDGHFEAVPEFLAQVEAAGVRSTLFVPMWKDGVLLGVVIVYRREVRRFADAQVRVLQGFADQAVVAMENARLLGEQREALEQQTATAEVLEAINASPGSLEPVFGTMLDKAMRLCEAAFGIFGRFDGELFEPIVDRGVPPELIESTRRIQSPPPGSGLGRLAAGESVVQLVDLANTEIYRAGFVGARALVDIGGARTAIFVALRKDGVLRGVIVMYRREVRAFSAKQVALLQNFAAQAVIAMENARLLTEQREALERQTATADILRVISQSPTDASPVFEAIADSALRLLDGWSVVVWRLDGDVLRPASIRGGAPDSAGAVEVTFPTLPRGRSFVWEALDRRAAVCISDVEAEGTDPDVREVARRRGWRANAAVPMLRDGEPLGVVAVSRVRPGPFAARELALLESFAAQAVIAIENVRLFTELQKRTDDLTESLDYQTATSELLEVVTRSAADIQPVLDAMLASAARLCEAGIGGVVVKQGEEFWYRALQGGTPELFPALSARPIAPEPGTVAGQTLLTRDVVHVADIHAYPDYAIPQVLKEVRTALGVPLLREGELLGAIVLTRDRVEPFSERQIALVKTFADQAVIALENARLLTELRESLDRQTATAEILRVINASPGDLTPVFDAILEKAHSVCGADMGSLFLRDGANFRAITTMGYDAAIDAMLRQSRPPIPAMASITWPICRPTTATARAPLPSARNSRRARASAPT
jgi:GAF domain-containing protein